VNEIGNIDPIGEVQKDVEREFANVDPMVETKPAEVAGVTPLPQIDVPLPAVPALVTEKNFAPVKSKPTKRVPVKARAKKPAKKSGSRA
jgi:hypothetical protein